MKINKGNFVLHFILTVTPSDIYIFLSQSDILGPNGKLSDIKNLVSFQRELFKDSNYIYIE